MLYFAILHSIELPIHCIQNLFPLGVFVLEGMSVYNFVFMCRPTSNPSKRRKFAPWKGIGGIDILQRFQRPEALGVHKCTGKGMGKDKTESDMMGHVKTW